MNKALYAIITLPLLFLFALPVASQEKAERNWQDETIYSIMIDRFNNGDNSNDFEVDTRNPLAYHGGDFEGVIMQLDYIKDMGFTTILLSPIFDNNESGYHGYAVNDFYMPDEHFGSMESFKTLVNEAHERDMKVVIDFVVNYVGSDHVWTKDPGKKDWFLQTEEMTHQNQLAFPWLEGLHELNLANPEVQEYLVDAATWWVKETGIDGYRLESVNQVPGDFWSDFSRAVKEVNSDIYLLGEVAPEDSSSIMDHEKSGINGFSDYTFNQPLRAAFAQPDQPMTELISAITEKEQLYKDPSLVVKFLDNHHTSRFTTDAANLNEHPGARWKMALTYLYTTPGIPMVFYGSEIALSGGEAPDNFQQMNFMTDKELVDYITQLGEIRGELPSLSRGSFELLHEKDGLAVYKREYEGEISVIAINNTSGTQSVDISAQNLKEDMELRGMLNGDLVRSNEGNYKIVLDREEAEVYVLSERTGINVAYLIAMVVVVLLFIVFITLLKRRARNGSN
ncbi:alpha-amylase [Mesobacillus persicus]|uniref:Alpha-amylase n=1 Tax=Mesobacillus persicus TaxID=930146 RepID=A0A1H8E2H2_9BACI|nr:alpha-amylase family glycosyl hydrolase [Mesobacillus persicus]SEN13643.1 alpha-amylase [Mesobacillus persicus]